jgi:hypothetical protein
MKYTFEAFTPCASRKEAKYRFLACALDGIAAHNAGKTVASNPFRADSPEGIAWQHGWEDMRDVRVCTNADNQSLARSDDTLRGVVRHV